MVWVPIQMPAGSRCRSSCCSVQVQRQGKTCVSGSRKELPLIHGRVSFLGLLKPTLTGWGPPLLGKAIHLFSLPIQAFVSIRHTFTGTPRTMLDDPFGYYLIRSSWCIKLTITVVCPTLSWYVLSSNRLWLLLHWSSYVKLFFFFFFKFCQMLAFYFFILPNIHFFFCKSSRYLF